MVEHEKITKALAKIPYAQTLGVKPLFIGEEFTLVMPYVETNIGNPTLPALHGGSISGLMEMAAIAQLMLEHEGGKLRVANVRVQAWQDDYDKPIAAMHGHYLMAKAQ